MEIRKKAERGRMKIMDEGYNSHVAEG